MSLYTKAIKDANIARAPSNLANNRVPDTHKATLKLAELYDNSSSGLSASTVQLAIDELASASSSHANDIIDLIAADAAAASGSGFRKLYAKAIVDMADVTLGTNYVVDVNIPDNAIITNAWIDVTDTVAGATDDTLTIAVQVQSANDIVSAIAVNDASNPWDAGIQAGIPVGTAATAIKLTAERDITIVTVANGNASATGAFDVYVEYMIGE